MKCFNREFNGEALDKTLEVLFGTAARDNAFRVYGVFEQAMLSGYNSGFHEGFKVARDAAQTDEDVAREQTIRAFEKMFADDPEPDAAEYVMQRDSGDEQPEKRA